VIDAAADELSWLASIGSIKTLAQKIILPMGKANFPQIARIGGHEFKQWFKGAFGRDCGCLITTHAAWIENNCRGLSPDGPPL
jgi:hypothetical protein